MWTRIFSVMSCPDVCQTNESLGFNPSVCYNLSKPMDMLIDCVVHQKIKSKRRLDDVDSPYMACPSKSANKVQVFKKIDFFIDVNLIASIYVLTNSNGKPMSQ